MIITRTPLRISFVGGGSDLPWFYNEEPGACVAAAIDKYVYVTYSTKYEDVYRAAYSQMETVDHIDQLQHELIREVLKAVQPDYAKMHGREIHSIADIPGGTGLGSSSAFTVGLLHALYPEMLPGPLALAAIGIELGQCHKAIGIQDQMIAAMGGVHLYGFGPKVGGQVVAPRITPVACDYEALSSHLLLLDTGLRRQEDAGVTLSGQVWDRELLRALAVMAEPFAKALAHGSFQLCGSIMDAAWMIKKQFVGDVFDQWYRTAKIEGAWGGKLCGAGGGGFMLFMAPPETHVRIKAALRLRYVPIRVGVQGSQVVYQD